MKALALTLTLLLPLPLQADEPFKPSITVSGLAQIHARGFADQSGPVTETPDTFLLRRTEIRVTGAITPRISGVIVIDPAKQLNAGSNGVTQSSNVLQDALISYQLSTKTFIDIGQSKIPIGYEGDLVSSASLQNVERALIFQARDPQGGGQGDIRDTGVRIRTTTGPFELQFGIFNGLGERQNTTSAGDEKALVGRAIYNVPTIAGLRLGISAGDSQSDTAPRRTIASAFAVYKRGRATVQTEYAGAKNRFEPRGYYAHFGWALTPAIETTARYDTFAFDRHRRGVEVRDAILGINYLIRGNNAKIQANLIHRDGGENLAGAPFTSSAAAFSNSGTQLRLNFQVGF